MLANIWTGKTGALCKIKDWFAAQTIGKTDITRWEIRPLCKNLAPAFAFFAAFAFFVAAFALKVKSQQEKKKRQQNLKDTQMAPWMWSEQCKRRFEG